MVEVVVALHECRPGKVRADGEGEGTGAGGGVGGKGEGEMGGGERPGKEGGREPGKMPGREPGREGERHLWGSRNEGWFSEPCPERNGTTPCTVTAQLIHVKPLHA